MTAAAAATTAATAAMTAATVAMTAVTVAVTAAAAFAVTAAAAVTAATAMPGGESLSRAAFREGTPGPASTVRSVIFAKYACQANF
jgi:hypothetical protein